MSQALPEATKRVIAQQLRELEASGIITKKIYDEVPLRVEYSLTSLGQSLQPVMKALQEWGEAYEAPVSTAIQPQG
jgi:DNA-binding HxlR family transcriptional regulator